MKLPENLNIETIMVAVESRETGLDNPGFCLNCGAEVDGCEPDARDCHCDECGENKVFGAEEILLMVS